MRRASARNRSRPREAGSSPSARVNSTIAPAVAPLLAQPVEQRVAGRLRRRAEPGDIERPRRGGHRPPGDAGQRLRAPGAWRQDGVEPAEHRPPGRARRRRGEEPDGQPPVEQPRPEPGDEGQDALRRQIDQGEGVRQILRRDQVHPRLGIEQAGDVHRRDGDPGRLQRRHHVARRPARLGGQGERPEIVHTRIAARDLAQRCAAPGEDAAERRQAVFRHAGGLPMRGGVGEFPGGDPPGDIGVRGQVGDRVEMARNGGRLDEVPEKFGERRLVGAPAPVQHLAAGARPPRRAAVPARRRRLRHRPARSRARRRRRARERRGPAPDGARGARRSRRAGNARGRSAPCRRAASRPRRDGRRGRIPRRTTRRAAAPRARRAAHRAPRASSRHPGRVRPRRRVSRSAPRASRSSRNAGTRTRRAPPRPAPRHRGSAPGRPPRRTARWARGSAARHWPRRTRRAENRQSRRAPGNPARSGRGRRSG